MQGYTPKPDENMNPWTNEIAPDYFRTLGMPLVMGREFTERDVAGAPLVAIVNETFAKHFFGNENPIGRRFGFRSMNNPGAIEIVGVVKDSLYADMRQGTTGEERNAALRLHAVSAERGAERDDGLRPRGGGVGAAMPEQLRQAVRRADAALPVFELQTMEQTVDEALFNERMLALLSASFGLLATRARRDRSLRRDVVHGVAPHARDRHSHRARRRARARCCGWCCAKWRS